MIIKVFKGFTFEENVKSINNLYSDYRIRISNLSFIYIGQGDKKNNISINKITIDNELFYYPKNFLYLVVYYKDFLFYLNIKRC